MRYHDSLAEAKTKHDKVLAFLEEYSLPVTPVNYAVGYEYVSNSTPVLTKLVVQRAQTEQAFDAYFMEEVYSDFILKKDPLKKDLVDNVDTAIISLRETCDKASHDVEDFVSEVDSGLSSLTDNMPDALKETILHLSESAKSVSQSQKGLLQKLAETQEHTDELRQELAQAKKEAITDSLTGLLNRKGMKQHADEWEKNTPRTIMAALVIDIDHFKSFNDNFGHLLGDVILNKVAQQIKKFVMDLGIPIRFGGEEFLVLLPQVNIETAQEIAERIRLGVEKMRFVSAKTKQQLPPLTVSLGVTLSHANESFEEFIERADHALYDAKNGGRNRVVSQLENVA